MKKKNEKKQKPMGFFNVGFFEKTHWVQSNRTQSGPPCLSDMLDAKHSDETLSDSDGGAWSEDSNSDDENRFDLTVH